MSGQRGLASPRASRWGATDAYPDTEDAEVMVGVTVETATAVENVDAIASVPELGFLFDGRNDLSVSLGHARDADTRRSARPSRPSARPASNTTSPSAASPPARTTSVGRSRRATSC